MIAVLYVLMIVAVIAVTITRIALIPRPPQHTFTCVSAPSEAPAQEPPMSREPIQVFHCTENN